MIIQLLYLQINKINMKDTEAEILENTIGGFGGSDPTPEDQPRSLGKAKYYNQKHESSGDSKPMFKTGWIEIDPQEFGMRAQFYPSDWKFYIQPASVNDIKNWSSIDDENAIQVNEVLDEMLHNNIKITSNNGTINPGKINAWDKFWFLIKIREYTFATGENAIKFEEPCKECLKDITYELTADSLVFEFPDQEVIDRHWNREDRTWVINPNDYDVNGPVLVFNVPTLERENAIFDWLVKENQKSSNKNKAANNSTFIKFLPWLLNKSSRDERIMARYIADAESVYSAWGVNMFGLADTVLRNIIVEPKEEIRAICPHCGEETVAEAQFPNGFRGLFTVQGGHKRFGSK